MTPADKHLRSKCVDQALTLASVQVDRSVGKVLDTAEQIWAYINKEAKEPEDKRGQPKKAPAKKKDADFG